MAAFYSLITQPLSQILHRAISLVGVVVDAALGGEFDSQSRSPYRENLSELNKNNPGDYIRLLKVYDMGEFGFACDLRVFSQQEAPPYAALSYGWGKGTADMYAYFGRNMSISRFKKITAHLHAALTQIKSFDELGWLWVDAICINQDSIDEKNDQVSRMKEIYGRAKQVYVWLGEDASDIPCGESTVNNLAKPFGIPGSTMIALAGQGPYVWWNRLWVVQEISVCGDIVVVRGDKRIDWNGFTQEVMNDRWTRSIYQLDKVMNTAGFLTSSWLSMSFFSGFRQTISDMLDIRRQFKELNGAGLDQTPAQSIHVNLDCNPALQSTIPSRQLRDLVIS